MRKTKILCTLGPATESPEVIAELIAKGADVMRLNMSHASHDWVRAVYARIREAAAASKREIAVLMDLTGPSIRTGDVEQPWQLQVGDTVEFRCKPEATASTHYSVTMNYPDLGKDLKAGDIIMVDGGMIQIKGENQQWRFDSTPVYEKLMLAASRHPEKLTSVDKLLERIKQETLDVEEPIISTEFDGFWGVFRDFMNSRK